VTLSDADGSPHPLTALFAPRSVVVLGVSRNPAKLGFRLLQNVKSGGFAGAVHVVNPSGEPILGTPTVATVDALPAGIDLALVSLPAPAVPGAIASLARREVRAAVVLSSGFGEVDALGREGQAVLLARARTAGLRLVGPNCMGVYSAPARLNGTYFWDLPRVAGGIGVVSQSGAYGGLVFRHLGSRGLGISRFLSIGNQADVETAEVLEYLSEDPETTLIACFVEAVRDGRRFVEVARRATARKPVVVLKGGRSDAGRRAAGSHTGALAGAYDVYRAACDQAGVVLAEETEEFFDAIETLARIGPARPAAPSIAVITVSGGPSVVAADAAERVGLRVPALDEATRGKLRALLPPFAAVGNPVDLTPQVEPANIAAAAAVVLGDPAIAGAVAVDVGLDLPEFGDALVEVARATGKPVVAFAADTPGLAARLASAGIPVLPSPERAARGWHALWAARPRPRPPSPPPRALPPAVAEALGSRGGALAHPIARRALETFGVRFCREAIVATAEEAVNAATAIGYPVAVKVRAEGLMHKTEVGGVRLDVRDAAGVRRACGELAAIAGAEGFIVQERVGPGVELLLGARRDESFGAVVAVGVGGVLAEVIRDVDLCLAPVSEAEAREMLWGGARGRLLAGPRGLPRVDDARLVEAVVGLGELMLAEPRIREIDLNPVIAAGATAVAVDALVIVAREGERT
jgi:acyl-CoA synthetase (NDP forming)